jgi:hypothetical protein
MKTLILGTWLVGALTLAACASDDAPESCSTRGGAACFVVPEAPLAAFAADDTPVPVALGCGPLTPTAAPSAVTLTGTIHDPISSATVPYAQLVVYGSAAFVDPIATTTTDATGTYSLTLPAGTPDVLYAQLAARGYLPEVVLQHAYDTRAQPVSFAPYLLTPDDADTEAALVRTTYDPGKGAGAVFAHDCNRARLANAAITVSSTSRQRTFVDGLVVAYTADTALVPELLSVQRATSRQGAAGVVNVPPGTTLYAQAWGFPDAASVARGETGLVLLDELPFRVDAGSVTGIELYAR